MNSDWTKAVLICIIALSILFYVWKIRVCAKLISQYLRVLMTDKLREVFWKYLQIAPVDCTGKEQHLCKSIINPPKLLQLIIFVLIEITLSISLITKIRHLGLYSPIYPLVSSIPPVFYKMPLFKYRFLQAKWMNSFSRWQD